MSGPQPRLLTERFWEKVQKADGCWLWIARKTKKGYGHFRVSKTKRMFAHRLAYTLTHGEIPDGMSVCHHCDNPPCCNPDHLFLGTNAENIADRNRKGRTVKGEKVRGGKGGNRLTEQKVQEIRSRHKRGSQCRALADQYGVSYGTVWKIVQGRTWKHLL